MRVRNLAPLRRAEVSHTEVGLWFAVAVAVTSLMVMSLSPMDDFNNVHKSLYWFVHGFDVYQGDYSSTDPQYLYSPGGTLLLSPIGFVTHYALAHRLFSFVNAVSIIVALVLMLRSIDIRGWKVPAVVLAALASTPVYYSVTLGNVNGVLLLGFVLSLLSLKDGKLISAGVFLGLIAVVKPMFLPVIVIVLVAGFWKVTGVSLAVYVVVNTLGYVMVPDAHMYRDLVMPYVANPRPYYNPALRGLAAEFGWSEWVLVVSLTSVAVLFIAGVVLSYGVWKENKFGWVMVMSVDTLAGVWLLSSLGQGYYSMFLIPVVLVGFEKFFPLRSAFGVGSFALMFYPLNWGSHERNMYIATIEWVVFLVGVVVVLVRCGGMRDLLGVRKQ